MYRNIVKTVQRILCTLYSLSPNIDILHNPGTFVKTKKQTLYITINETRFYFDFLKFPSIVLFLG